MKGSKSFKRFVRKHKQAGVAFVRGNGVMRVVAEEGSKMNGVGKITKSCATLSAIFKTK